MIIIRYKDGRQSCITSQKHSAACSDFALAGRAARSKLQTGPLAFDRKQPPLNIVLIILLVSPSHVPGLRWGLV